MAKRKHKESFFEKVEGEVVGAATSYYKQKVQKKLIQIGEISVLAVLALFLISIGLAMLIGHAFPVLSPGYNFLVLGAIFLLMGFILSR